MASAFPPPTSASPTAVTALRSPEPSGGSAPDRALGRRQSLPGGRAVIGAALVMAATVLVFAAYRQATATPTQTYVVARTKLPAGTKLSAADVAVVNGQLPDSVAERVFASPRQLQDAVLLAPLEPNELVTSSGVRLAEQGEANLRPYQFSFLADAAQVGEDRVRPSEWIELFRVDDKDSASQATLVTRLPLIAVDPGSSSGSGSSVVLTVALKDRAQAAEVAAVTARGPGKIAIVRTSFTDDADGSAGSATPTTAAPSTVLPTFPTTAPPTTAAPPPPVFPPAPPTSADAPPATKKR